MKKLSINPDFDLIKTQAKQDADAGCDYNANRFGPSIEAYLNSDHPVFFNELIKNLKLTETILYYCSIASLLETHFIQESNIELQPFQLTELVQSSIRSKIDSDLQQIPMEL